jgi:uncharacterized protein (TIGR02246 family)
MMDAKTAKENEVLALYLTFIQQWNNRDAAAMAACCANNCTLIGFDGSLIQGRQNIERQLSGIFADHATPRYVTLPAKVTFLHAQIAQLLAHVGMVATGKDQVDPALNAVQSVTLVKQNGHWLIEQYQNTPAQYHNNPQATQALTADLNRAAKN